MEDSTSAPELLEFKTRLQEGGETFVGQAFAGMSPAGIQWLANAMRVLEQSVEQTLRDDDIDVGRMCIVEFHATLKLTERSLRSGVSIGGGPVVPPPVNITALRVVVEYYLAKHGQSDLAWKCLVGAVRDGHTRIHGRPGASVRASGTKSAHTEPPLSGDVKRVLRILAKAISDRLWFAMIYFIVTAITCIQVMFTSSLVSGIAAIVACWLCFVGPASVAGALRARHESNYSANELIGIAAIAMAMTAAGMVLMIWSGYQLNILGVAIEGPYWALTGVFIALIVTKKEHVQ